MNTSETASVLLRILQLGFARSQIDQGTYLSLMIDKNM